MKKFFLISMFIIALATLAGNLPYITRVLEYRPAPGQFINVMPEHHDGETYDDVLARANYALCGYIETDTVEAPDGSIAISTDTVTAREMICLGACGGYVVFGFDHPIVNVEGEYDFQILGNSFVADSISTEAGSSEPGIVYVSEDVNGNGIADDPWFELAGSEYHNPRTVHNFEITYYKTPEGHVPHKVNTFLLDDTYIRWTSNDPDSLQEGYIDRLSFHRQEYWPQWIDDEQVTFTCSKLPCNGFQTQNVETGQSLFVQRAYKWGYVDNRTDYRWREPLTDEIRDRYNLGFKIDWAVNDNGEPVKLRKIDFVKVQTAVHQKNGWLGEISTEVGGAFDIHPDAVLPEPAVVDGDLNHDTVVNTGDISILYDFIVQGSQELSGADINGDGNINTGDISELYEYILGTKK